MVKITQADIDTLIHESSKLNPGEMIVGTLKSTIIDAKSGMPQVRKSFVKDYVGEHETIVFPGTPLTGEGISGVANTDLIRYNQKATGKKEPFSFRKTLMGTLEERHINRLMFLLNAGRIAYDYDRLGRVYFIATDGAVCYVNKNQTGCIVAGTGEYYELVPNEEDFDMVPRTDVDTTYFDYLYVSKRAEEQALAEERRQEEAFSLDSIDFSGFEQQPIQPQPSKIVDLDEYRRRNEEGPHR